MKRNLFAQITKVDEKTRTVSGRMAQEVPDKSGEILDYAGSKPHFQRWVENTKKASGGKSLGNVRSMHGPLAAGKVTGIEFIDAEKAMDIMVKVVDDGEWKKVQEGVYTGFSIGGSYVGKPVVEGDLKRYVASPDEVSLVDNPCIPTATFFDVHKADGSVIQKAFKPKDAAAEGETSTAKEDSDAEDAKARGVKEGEDEANPKVGDDKMEEGETDDKKVPPVKGKKGEAADEEEADDTKKSAGPIEYEVDGSPEDLAKLQKVMTTHSLSVADVTDMADSLMKADWGHLFTVSLDKATFADPENRRFPLDTEAQVKAAMYYVGSDATKALYTDEQYGVVKLAVEKAWEGMLGELPEDVEKAVTEGDLAKSFYLSSQFCSAVDSLTYLCQSAEYQYANGTRADLAVKCKLAIRDLASCVAEMVNADVDALKDTAVKAVLSRAEDLVKLAEVDDESIRKIGARNSKTDGQRIQRIHDLAVELGAKSPVKNPNGVLEDPAKMAEGDLSKMATGDLQKLLESAVSKATAPLLERINKLEAQPVAPKAVLKAVPKNRDTGGDDSGAGSQIEPVRKHDGQVDEVATDIKSLHKGGGVPLFTK